MWYNVVMPSKRPSARTISVTFLGCGTSTGVPILTCTCAVCRSKNPKNKRLRSSIWFQITEGTGKSKATKSSTKSFVVDTGPDFRQQALREKIGRVDAVLYTHPHADHLNGVDDLRAYNFVQKADLPVYGNAWFNQEIQERFAYVFRGVREGGILPSLQSHLVQGSDPSFDVQGISIIPIALPHGSKETLGYRIDDIAYVTDCSYIPNSSLERLKGLEILILDCVRLEPHKTHLHLNKSLEIISELKPRKAYLTHLGHDFDYAKWVKKLPKGVTLAYDGLKLRS